MSNHDAAAKPEEPTSRAPDPEEELTQDELEAVAGGVEIHLTASAKAPTGDLRIPPAFKKGTGE